VYRCETCGWNREAGRKQLRVVQHKPGTKQCLKEWAVCDRCHSELTEARRLGHFLSTLDDLLKEFRERRRKQAEVEARERARREAERRQSVTVRHLPGTLKTVMESRVFVSSPHPEYQDGPSVNLPVELGRPAKKI
jgi:hypothetical protein